MYCSWEIAPYCNLACSHCYSTYHDSEFRTGVKLTSSQLDLGIKNLSQAGIKQLNLEGGEPTLLGGVLVKALVSCNSYGIKAIISTHGMFLLKDGFVSRLIEAGLDTLSLSLDGSTPTVNNYIRVDHSGNTSNQYERAIEFLAWFAKHKPPLKLKINTVVRKDNLTDLYGIGNMLNGLLSKDTPVQLKLVEVQPRGCGKSSYSSLRLCREDFVRLVSHVSKTCNFPVVHREYTGGLYPFIVITCSGYAVIPNGERHEPIVDCLGRLNIFESDFAVRLKKCVSTWPSFKKLNSSINTYNMAVVLPNALGHSVS